MSNFKQIGLALQYYHGDHGRYPPAVVYDSNGKPLHSWRVLILPYLEETSLYAKFNLAEPWDGPNNRVLLAHRPKVYAPAGVETDTTTTHAHVFNGPGAAFEGRTGLTSSDFTDVGGSTVLVVDAYDPVPWTRPIDLPYLEVGALPRLGGSLKPEERPFDRKSIPGFHVVFPDGSVRFLKMGIKESTLRALITRNGGEVIGSDDY